MWCTFQVDTREWFRVRLGSGLHSHLANQHYSTRSILQITFHNYPWPPFYSLDFVLHSGQWCMNMDWLYGYL